MKCPACSSEDLIPFIQIEAVPTHYNVPFKTREAALSSPRGAMNLAHCPACGFVYNVAFDPALIPYSEGYENSLHYSSRFDDFARGLASSLIERHGLHDKLIVEIGCGRGDFLCMLCEDGNRGIGCDPSYAGTKPERRGAENVSITAEPYAAWTSPAPVDLLCCRHTLEHVREPGPFLEGLRDMVNRSRTPGSVYFEVPNAAHMLESEAGIWDVTYEHCAYFSTTSLAAVFERAGYAVSGISSAFDDQFLSLHGSTQVGLSPSASTVAPVAWAGAVARFGDRFTRTVQQFDADLSRWHAQGRRPVVWGGGSKGITFLNVVPAAQDIEYVVDINPHKQGLFVPGSGQRFVSPDFLRDYQPEVVILMNAIYRDEVRGRLRDLGLAPELLTV